MDNAHCDGDNTTSPAAAIRNFHVTPNNVVRQSNADSDRSWLYTLKDRMHADLYEALL